MSSPPPMMIASTVSTSASRPSTQRTARPPAIQTLSANSGKIRQPERRDVVTPILGLVMSCPDSGQTGLFQKVAAPMRPALPQQGDNPMIVFPCFAQPVQKRRVLRHPFHRQPALPFIGQRPARIV